MCLIFVNIDCGEIHQSSSRELQLGKNCRWRQKSYDGKVRLELLGIDCSLAGTRPKFNVAPEKWWLEDDPFLLGR